MKLFEIPARDHSLPWLRDRAAPLCRYLLLYVFLLGAMVIGDRYDLGSPRFSDGTMSWEAAIDRIPRNAAFFGLAFGVIFVWHERSSARKKD